MTAAFNQKAFIGWCERNLVGWKNEEGDRFRANCPVHNDKHASLRVFANTAIFLCFGSCSGLQRYKKWYYHQFCKAAGLEPLEDKIYWVLPPQGKSFEQAFTATYTYVHSDGSPAFKVCRSTSKDFPSFRFSGGLWLPGLDGLTPPLYHLDELTAAADRATCLFVEGEKDCDAARSLGFLSTTKLGGAKITGFAEIAEPLLRLVTVIIPDNDSTGFAYGNAVLQHLLSSGGRAVLMPLPLDKPGGDLSDFIASEVQAGRDPAQSIASLIDRTFWRW